MGGIGQDLKLALRVFWKSPAFAVIVILTLALGSGANTAIFSLLDQVMLRSLPVERPDRLVVLSAPGPFSGGPSRGAARFRSRTRCSRGCATGRRPSRVFSPTCRARST